MIVCVFAMCFAVWYTKRCFITIASWMRFDLLLVLLWFRYRHLLFVVESWVWRWVDCIWEWLDRRLGMFLLWCRRCQDNSFYHQYLIFAMNFFPLLFDTDFFYYLFHRLFYFVHFIMCCNILIFKSGFGTIKTWTLLLN